jgi:hypothetical protein
VSAGVLRATAAWLSLAVGATAPAGAQGLGAPAGWRLDLDAPATAQPTEAEARARADAYWFVEMRPGWHITMGPGGRLFDSAFSAADRYALESNIFLFPGESAEGYGLFFGGRGEGAGATWVAVLLRRDGSAALLRHGPGAHEWVVPWARHEPIKPQAGDDPMGNLLKVDVRRDSVHVFANGTQLFAVTRADLVTDGGFGFRVGREVNLHASTLDYTRRLAAVPPPR